MAHSTRDEAVDFRGMADEAFGALAECFRWRRILAAVLGVGMAFVLAGIAGTAATTHLIRQSFGVAALLGVLGGFLLYVGLLVTYAALARMSVTEHYGEAATGGEAFGFALARLHIVVGVPLFALVVALGAGSLGGYLGAILAAGESLGAAMAPVALVVLFVVNLVLVCAVLITHCLTAPCVACLDASLATVLSRLYAIGYERLGAFFAHQAAVLLAAIPLLLLTTGIFTFAFQPAFQATLAGRAKAVLTQDQGESPILPGVPRDMPSLTPSEGGPADWYERARGWAAWASDAGGTPLISAGAVLVLLLGVFPLIFAASAQSGVYLALTGDRFLAGRSRAQPPRAAEAAPPEKHPPIVHCWRCDAINRFEAESCSKCGATLVVCPHCFATNEPESLVCSSCERLLGEREPVAAEAEAMGEGRHGVAEE